MSKNELALGDWNAICDMCGRKFKASQLKRNWKGLMCCQKDWEPRHPQDFVRAPSPEAVLPWTRPEAAPNIIPVCTLRGSSSVPGLMTPGCIVPSRPDLTNT